MKHYEISEENYKMLKEKLKEIKEDLEASQLCNWAYADGVFRGEYQMLSYILNDIVEEWDDKYMFTWIKE